MSKNQLPYWTSQLRLAYRNSSRQRRFTYKQNAARIDRDRAEYIYRAENKQLKQHEVLLPSKIESLSVAELQAVLCKDIAGNKGSELRFVLLNTKKSRDREIKNLTSHRNLFKNRIASTYTFPNSPNENGVYLNDSQEWNITLRLPTSDNTHIQVLWPSMELSLACRAIGVCDRDIYNEFQDKTVCHPVTGDPMPICFIPTGIPTKAPFTALAPQLNSSVCEPAVRELLPLAVIPSRRCTTKEVKKVREFCVDRTFLENSERTHPMILSSAKGFKSDLKRTSQLLKALESGSFFSTGSLKKRMCTTDILRATVLSNNITEEQLKAEYCKISILYSIFENLRRIKIRVENIEAGTGQQSLTSWDIQILKDLRELNQCRIDSNVDDLIKSKDRFDEFLSRLNTFNVIINAELRSAAKRSQKPDFDRQNSMVQVLSALISSCRILPALYPNMSFEMERFTQGIKPITFNSQENEKAEEGSRIINTVKAILDFESDVVGNENTPRDHKLVLLVAQPLPAEVARLFQFSTKLELQITTSLDAVRKVSNSECIMKRNIDHDTNIYLYEAKRLKLNVAEFLEKSAAN
ncbi:LAME_0A00782g1_1 [Lachancea meyersii CBS 8951]|uniref:LAME_0A00782g1_1 n=1 Tax=Lachancea meyersii CBS 8951 TaxID=1266667 RepID=A0A1G4ILR6_9SACH|nr:LAME_0A00782g1_1 [Lachancea meyersii CBS 8951]